MGRTKLTVNSFDGGRNTDTDKSKIQPNQYLEAYNLELIGDGTFYALKNIKGTTEISSLNLADGTEILGAFRNKYLIDSVLYNCITIFTAIPSGKFKIWCYDIENDVVYELFEEDVPSDYFTEDRVIDAVNFPENGTDILYFTDFYNEVRYLKCAIPASYSANFLTSYDLSLQRRGANGTISLTNVTTTGTLLSGTYQFAYRMADPVNKRFTKWSTLTNPIHVYTKANDSAPVYSGVGVITNRKIQLSITPSTEETDNFDYIQLAVVENIGVTTTTIEGVIVTSPLTASLLEITSIPGTSLSFDYKSNSRIGTIPIEDITVDLAQIDQVKTLNVKENRLFFGNLKYSDLEFDNGTPSITSGSILRYTGTETDLSSNDYTNSTHKGYWRDEVYRFGIVYTDEFGNRSSVQPLDLSLVTANQISGSLTDMKFPSRETSKTYTIFNSNGKIQTLGLQLNGITNHPTWARSFEIVRVPRKKNILFQTPIIPMSEINGIGALFNYPSLAQTIAGDTSYPDAQPQTSGTVYVPKNLFWPDPRQILINRNATPGNDKVTGEAYLFPQTSYTLGMMFPSQNLYNTDSPYVFTGAEKLDVIDYSLLKLNSSSVSIPKISKPITVINGDDVNTNISGNFNALSDGQYYFDSNWAAKSILSSYKDIVISDTEAFDNFGQPASVGGSTVMNYSSLQTTGIDYGYQPNIQRSVVFKYSNSTFLADPVRVGPTVFSAGTLNTYTPNAYIVGASGMRYDANTFPNNNFVTEYASYSEGSYVGGIMIGNVKLGLGDDRYGDFTTEHEYISTGAKHTFSASEISTLQGGGSVSVDLDVWGGDCFVGTHLIKVSDSSYSVVNQSKYSTSSQTDQNLIYKWGKWFKATYTAGSGAFSVNVPTNICLPVALENVAQYVQVILESEYNGEVRDYDLITSKGNSAGIPYFYDSSKDAMRTPLTYKYNLNVSKENDRKVFVNDPQFSFKQSEFSARIAYSDLKIYNSDQAGFDITRVGNIYDLEEKNYGITKLAVSGDNLYAIQQQGVIYVPTGERQIESSDAGILAVRSGDVIGRPVTVDSERGSQHLQSIVETGDLIYIVDNRNKNIYALSGQELKSVTKDNETLFRTLLGNKIPEKYVKGVYDPIRKEYWFIDTNADVCEVFNERLGVWVSRYESEDLVTGVYTNQNLYLINDSGDINTMYTGDVNQLFGTEVVPRVVFCVNPDGDISKTFDATMISATNRLDEIDYEVVEASVGSQTATVDLDITPAEGNFRVKTPRANGDRLRGLRMLATIKFKAVQSALQNVYHYYRTSSKTPF